MRSCRNRAGRYLIVAPILLSLAACSQSTEPGAGAAVPVKAELTAKGPAGLFFMTRYWSYTHTLERAAWYFSPEGEVYRNLQTGFSREDLAAHKDKGTYKLQGESMEVTWADGKTSKSNVEPDKGNKNAFTWDMGIFTAVTPFAGAPAVVGSYEGGESLSHGGNTAAVAKSLELRADGTYSAESVGYVRGMTGQSTLSAGSGGAESGTWKLDGYSIVLSSAGKTVRQIAFPYDDGKTGRLYLGGIMYKRK